MYVKECLSAADLVVLEVLRAQVRLLADLADVGADVLVAALVAPQLGGGGEGPGAALVGADEGAAAGVQPEVHLERALRLESLLTAHMLASERKRFSSFRNKCCGKEFFSQICTLCEKGWEISMNEVT